MTKEYYLSKGMSEREAEYFASGRKKIVKVVPLENYSLLLFFDNGEKRLLDISAMIKPNTVFEHIAKYEDFKRVYLDDSACVSWDINPEIDSTVMWNNKIDLCPDSCYLESVPIK